MTFLPLRLRCDQWCSWHWHMITGWLMAERQWRSCVRSRLWWRILVCCCLTCRGQQHHPVQQNKGAAPADRTEDIQESAGLHSSLFLLSLNGRGCFEMNPTGSVPPTFPVSSGDGSPSSQGKQVAVIGCSGIANCFHSQVDPASPFLLTFLGIQSCLARTSLLNLLLHRIVALIHYHQDWIPGEERWWLGLYRAGRL